ncbi:MAG: hypothetical protein ACRDH2_02975, partial [Anaerolineales bacterium]
LSAGQLSRPEATTTPGPLFLPLVIQTPHFVLQPGNPKYTQNFNELGCAYLGIAGQVFDLNDQHIIGLLVHIEGVDDPYDTITGSKPEFGPGGYELFLGFDPIDTTDVYSVQVRDLSGIPLSDAYFIPTFDDCAKNLILVNFVQDR